MVVWRQAQAEAAKRADGLGLFWDASLRVKGRVNLRRVQASIFFDQRFLQPRNLSSSAFNAISEVEDPVITSYIKDLRAQNLIST